MRSLLRLSVLLILALAPLTRVWAPPIGPVISHAEALEAGLISISEADDLFRLWNDCRPVGFSVHLPVTDAATRIGLTKEAVEIAVRSRLRSARIFKEHASPQSLEEQHGLLVVQVQMGRNIFLWSARFQKLMQDSATELVTWTYTGWMRSSFGGHNDDRNFILAAIAPGVDAFIDDYLRVNEPACK